MVAVAKHFAEYRFLDELMEILNVLIAQGDLHQAIDAVGRLCKRAPSSMPCFGFWLQRETGPGCLVGIHRSQPAAAASRSGRPMARSPK